MTKLYFHHFFQWLADKLITKWMNRQIVVDPYDGILCRNKKEQSIGTQNIQIIMLNEWRWIKVSIYYMTPLCKVLENANLQWRKAWQWLPVVGGDASRDRRRGLQRSKRKLRVWHIHTHTNTHIHTHACTHMYMSNFIVVMVSQVCMYKHMKWYTLNMFSLFYVSYTSIKQKKRVGTITICPYCYLN